MRNGDCRFPAGAVVAKAEVAMPIHFDQLYVNGEWRHAADGAHHGIMEFLETQYVSLGW